jgi:hypothetical protein
MGAHQKCAASKVTHRISTNSISGGKGSTHGEIASQAGRASHRKGTVTPRRRPNADLRTREYLTEGEVERLIEAARGNRWGHRDAAMILVALSARPAGV